MTSNATMVAEVRNWIKENDYPLDIPFGPDALLTGSVMFYLFTDATRCKKRKASWTPNNVDIACTEAGFERIKAYLLQCGFLHSMVVGKWPAHETYAKVELSRFRKDGRCINVHYSKDMEAIEIINSFNIEVSKQDYFDGTNVLSLPRTDHFVDHKPAHQLMEWKVPKRGQASSSHDKQLQNLLKYAERGVTFNVLIRMDDEDQSSPK